MLLRKKRLLSCLIALSLALAVILPACTLPIDQVGAVDQTQAAADTEAAPESRAIIAGFDSAPSNADQGSMLHAYMWKFNDIKNALPTIAASGYTSVQVSPVQRTKDSASTWWLLYQPCNFDIGNTQLGSYDEFASLCTAADAYGIKIIVDAVVNHVADNGTDGVWSDAVDSYLKNSSYYHNQGTCTNYSSRWNVTQQNLGNLPDLNTQNSSVQGFIINFLNKCATAGADGFRFDAAKHIETNLGEDAGQSWAGTFWSATMNALSGKNLYLYGEVLPDGGDNHEVYANYYDITAHGYIWTVLNGVNNKNLTGVVNYNHQTSTLAPSTVLAYIENHDTYEHAETTSQSYWTRKMANAVILSRANITPHVFDRPTEDLWKDADIVAMNIFRNKCYGLSEYLRFPNSACLAVERGNKGIAFINTGSSAASINIASTLPAGSYSSTSSTAATLTVAGGYVTGSIPAGCIVTIISGGTTPVPATPVISSVNNATSSSLTVSWGAVSGATSYTVYRSSSSTGTYASVGTSTGTSFVNSGLSASTTYWYKVSASNSAGTSAQSAAISGTTSSGSGFSSNFSSMYLRGSMNSWGATAMTLTANNTWTVTGVSLTASTAYTYKYEISGATTWSTNWGAGSTAGIAVLNGGNIAYTPSSTTTYTFSFNDSTLAYSVVASGGTTIPAVPVISSVNSATTSSLTVSWAAVSGATSYTVYRSATSTGTYASVGTSSSTSFVNSGLTASTTYWYKVAASNSAGSSAQSAAVSGTTSSGSTATTTINIVYDVGMGNTMYVRGSLSPLSWTTGIAMTWTTGNVWTYSTTAIASGAAFEFKGLINNATWSDGANFVGTGGSTITVTPTFNGNFYDTMDNLNNWTVSGYTGTGKWHIYSAQARAYACSTESLMTYKYAMSKKGTTVTLAYKYAVTGLDTGEYLAVDVSANGGTTWTQVASYTGTKAATNASINVTAYQSDNFKLRFRTKMNSTAEYAYMDNVTVSVVK